MFVFGVSLSSRQSSSKELIANPSSLIEENTSNGCETRTPSNFRKLLPLYREKKKMSLTHIHDKLTDFFLIVLEFKSLNSYFSGPKSKCWQALVK